MEQEIFTQVPEKYNLSGPKSNGKVAAI